MGVLECRQNHWLDAIYNASAAGHYCGVRLVEEQAPKRRLAVLLITLRHRHTIPNPERGVYRFSLKNDKIKAMPKIQWLYKNDVERARYTRWRKTLRELEGINPNTTDERTDEREPE